MFKCIDYSTYACIFYFLSEYPTVSATTGSGDIFYYTIFQLVEYPLLNLKRMVMQLYT